MATVLLSAAGAAIGSGIGGSVLGLSGAVLGRAVGAAIGRSIDQRLLGNGSAAIETGKVERFRLTTASYGTPVREFWGRMRLSGQVIWATRFQEQRQTTSTGGGKGTAPRTTTTTFSYSISLAIALCSGPALALGRIWADGVEIAPSSLDIRFYNGGEDQLPDPKIEAVEGAGLAPAYRGICYVVIEDLQLARFGNRVPQFSFEVIRNAKPRDSEDAMALSDIINAVALIPGSGEYSLATTPVHVQHGPGLNSSQNVHTINPETDFGVSLRQLGDELPNCQSVSLVVSWFGNDLRCGTCEIRPKVEQSTVEGEEMPWSVSGLTRAQAAQVPTDMDAPVYGGTPTDQSVIEAIQAIKAAGKEVMFYPFILMDQGEANGLPDPWSEEPNQPILPWRGRITLNRAPGMPGSSDQTLAAAMEVASFVGMAQQTDFAPAGQTVGYSGPSEWSYRRFILHYAHLCVLAGGVDSFCIGSEMRGMTQIRSSASDFPFVDALVQLASEVRQILGPGTKLSYAADWSEYFGYHRGQDVLFHLDPLWSSAHIDFIGIDNYMPISDWRNSPGHADEVWGSIYDLGYLAENIAGGEGFDWYYEDPEAASQQRRTPILDTAHQEHWVFAYKDIKSWWSNQHFNRIGGLRTESPTAWVPGSKPIRFTEYGCAALNLATNEPNKFLDPKSSESSLPRGSDGQRDDLLQMRYFQAMHRFWNDPKNNPPASLYSGSMVDFGRAHAWAWDARPFPQFPADRITWSDAENYDKGHWLNGRSSNQSIADVVREICDALPADQMDTSHLHAVLRGYETESTDSPRAKIQPLQGAFDLVAAEREGTLALFNRHSKAATALTPETAANPESDAIVLTMDPSEAELDQFTLSYLQSESDFELRSASARSPGASLKARGEGQFPILLSVAEANQVAERMLNSAATSRQALVGAWPCSKLPLSAGDVVSFQKDLYLLDTVEDLGFLRVSATRIDPLAQSSATDRGQNPLKPPASANTPVFATFLDLPIFREGDTDHAPYVAVAASPWPGQVSIWSSPSLDNFTLNANVQGPALVGETTSALAQAPSCLMDLGSKLQVFIPKGELSSVSDDDVLNGANLFAIGDGSSGNWELAQFGGATLVGNGVYELSRLIRGLGGSDAATGGAWPAGSLFVLLDPSVVQISHPLSLRGLARNYRIGPSSLGYADPNVISRLESFVANGLRPLSPVHLAAAETPGGDLTFSWIRRSRVDADSWSSIEVPMGEDTEQYNISVIVGAQVVRQVQVTAPQWTYSSADQLLDGVSRPFVLRVGQLSASFGLGVEAVLTVN